MARSLDRSRDESVRRSVRPSVRPSIRPPIRPPVYIRSNTEHRSFNFIGSLGLWALCFLYRPKLFCSIEGAAVMCAKHACGRQIRSQAVVCGGADDTSHPLHALLGTPFSKLLELLKCPQHQSMTMAAFRDAHYGLVETLIGVCGKEPRVALPPGLSRYMACQGDRFFFVQYTNHLQKGWVG